MMGSVSSSMLSVFKIDRFSVPVAAYRAFSERVRWIQAVLQRQPGCLQNLVLDGPEGRDGARELLTLVGWAREADLQAARAAVAAAMAADGFDPAAFMQRLGVVPAMALYRPAVDERPGDA